MFDPPHIGHLSCAEQAASRFGLEKVFFVPALIPPHKEEIHGSAEERYEMTQIATKGNPLFEVSRMELDRKGGKASYTIDTVLEFREKVGDDLHFILGADAFSEIHTWKSADELLRKCNFIVISRPGWDAGEAASRDVAKLASIGVHLEGKQIVYNKGVEEFSIPGSTYKVFFYSPFLLDISSTRIREAILKGDSVKDVVSPEVEQYITNKGIYMKAGK